MTVHRFEDRIGCADRVRMGHSFEPVASYLNLVKLPVTVPANASTSVHTATPNYCVWIVNAARRVPRAISSDSREWQRDEEGLYNNLETTLIGTRHMW